MLARKAPQPSAAMLALRAPQPSAAMLALKSALLSAAMLALLCAVPRQAAAQPDLNFKRLVSNWPTIELYFTVECNGQPAWFTDKQYFTVMENSVLVGNFELWCPYPPERCPPSAALVFDASADMAGSGNAIAKAAGNAFLDMMDGVVEEAAILWFNQWVTTYQGMTTSLDLLHWAVNAVPASGGRALWDGIYVGLLELINNGVTQCRAVIAMTKGQDNASSHQPAEIISLANRNRLRVYIVSLDSSADEPQMQAITDQTIGRFYRASNASQAAAIYTEIFSIMFQGFQECMITYTGQCKDGSRRTVDLTLSNFCSGADTATKVYTAPRDTTTFTALRLGLGTASLRGGESVAVPLRVLDTIPAGSVLHPASFTILYDTARARCTGIATPPGTLLEGVPADVTAIPGGARIETRVGKRFIAAQAPAVLAELTFTAGDPAGTDTVRCPLALADWSFAAGCFGPMLQSGELRIIPRTNDGADAGSAAPLQPDLYPDPGTGMVTVRVPSRSGDKVRIAVLDMLGRELIIEHGTSVAGEYRTALRIAPATPGTYFLHISAGDRRWVRSLRVY
jgi:hypothetical protein